MKQFLLRLFLIAAASFARADDGDVPDALRSAVTQALEAGSIFDQPVGPADVGRRQDEFRAALNVIADRCDARTAELCRSREGDAMTYKIVRLALDFRENPQRYAEIDQKILQASLPAPGETSEGNPNYPEPKAPQVNEDYRGVWEYFLFWPQPATTNHRSLGDFHGVVLRSLERINSPKTQVLYEYCFKEAAKADIIGREWTDERVPWQSLLSGMARQRTPETVRRMLGCLAVLKPNQRTYEHVKEYFEGTLLGVDGFLIQAYSKGILPKEPRILAKWRVKRAVWRDAINQIPMADLDPGDQAMLHQVLDAPEY